MKLLLLIFISLISLSGLSQEDMSGHSRLSFMFNTSPRQELKSDVEVGILSKYMGTYFGFSSYRNYKDPFLSITLMGRIALLDNQFTINPFGNITFDKSVNWGSKFFYEPSRTVSIGTSFSKEISLSFLLNFDVEGYNHLYHIHTRRK